MDRYFLAQIDSTVVYGNYSYATKVLLTAPGEAAAQDALDGAVGQWLGEEGEWIEDTFGMVCQFGEGEEASGRILKEIPAEHDQVLKLYMDHFTMEVTQ